MKPKAPQPAPTLSTFNQVMAALRNPAVNLGDLDVCKACLSVEAPYLHSAGTPCPTGPTVAAPQPAPSALDAREVLAEPQDTEGLARLLMTQPKLESVDHLLDEPAPSGDEAKVREIANSADIGVIVTRLGGTNRQLDEVYDLLDKLQKQAKAAGKADGAREEREACGRLALERLNHWRDNCQDNIDAGCAPPQYNMGSRAEASIILGAIARRGSEG